MAECIIPKGTLEQRLVRFFSTEEFHGHPDFYKLLAKMAALHSRKNHDYAGTGHPLRNFHKSREQGVEPWRGVMIRLTDKWSRLESFCKQDTLEVTDESVEDTLLDNAIYSLLAIILRREQTEGLMNREFDKAYEVTEADIADKNQEIVNYNKEVEDYNKS